MKWLIGYLEEYFGHAQTTASKSKEHSSGVREDASLNQAMAELRTLLERFADGRSMDDMKSRFQALYDDAQNDQELRNWFGEFDSYARKVSALPIDRSIMSQCFI